MARRSLLAAHAVELPPPGAAPDWLHLLPFGTFQGRDGRGPYRLTDAAHAARVVKTTAAYQRGADLPIDYGHQILHAAANGQPAVASGWIKEFAVRDDGLWGRVEWTAAASARIEAREFRYLSPVFRHAADGTVTRIVAAALTNLPNLELTALASADPRTPEPEEEPDPMDPELAKALGLTPGATGDQIAAAAQALTGAAKKGEPDPAAYVPMAAFQDLQTKVAAMAQAQATGRAAEAVAKAKAEGKVSPAMFGGDALRGF